MEEGASSHFQNIFRDPGENTIVRQLEVIRCFPLYFSLEEGKVVADQVSLEEVRKILIGFARTKSPGLNGWTIELFLEFFELVGPNLLATVEESGL